LRPAEWGSGVSLHGSNPELLMSALGQKRTSQQVIQMSALPPKADSGTRSRNVRFAPEAELNDVAAETFAKGWKAEIGVQRGGLTPLSRGWLSENPPDDFVASGLETPAMTEQNALGLPRVDFCERRLCLPPLQQ